MSPEMMEDFKLMICDKLTPEELIEVLGVSTETVFERFYEECMEFDWSEVI